MLLINICIYLRVRIFQEFVHHWLEKKTWNFWAGGGGGGKPPPGAQKSPPLPLEGLNPYPPPGGPGLSLPLEVGPVPMFEFVMLICLMSWLKKVTLIIFTFVISLWYVYLVYMLSTVSLVCRCSAVGRVGSGSDSRHYALRILWCALRLALLCQI